MREAFVEADSLPEAYHLALCRLSEEGEISPCPDYNTTQKELGMTIFIREPLKEPMISRLFIGGPRELEQYRQEMLDGILDFEVDRGKWTYTYHRRMEWQFPFLHEELQRNPYSRRAVICVRDSSDMQSDDPACLQHLQFFVRDGALHCKVLFRSNDACKATYMNAFALIMLQKRFADELGYRMGTYTHRANSFHCYEKDFEMLDGYCKRIDAGGPGDESITFDYEYGWQDIMEEYRAEIAASVEELKQH